VKLAHLPVGFKGRAGPLPHCCPGRHRRAGERRPPGRP
jgi:hypothetical protein